MNRIIIVIVIAIAACHEHTVGPEQVEDATVEETTFQPSVGYSGSSIDMTGKGGVSFSSGTTDAKWTVVYRCQHGKFAIESDRNDKARDMWKLVSRGEHVSLHYRERFSDGKPDGYETISVERKATP